VAGCFRNGKSRSPAGAGDEVVSLLSVLALANSFTVREDCCRKSFLLLPLEFGILNSGSRLCRAVFSVVNLA